MNPTPRAIVSRPVSRPVPVSMQRPILINQQGRQIAARPGATPVAPPVRQAAADETDCRDARLLRLRRIAPAGPREEISSLGIPEPEAKAQPAASNRIRRTNNRTAYPGGAPRANPVAPGQGVQRPLQPGNQNQPNQPGDNNDRRQAPGAPFGRPTPPATPPTYQQQGQQIRGRIRMA